MSSKRRVVFIMLVLFASWSPFIRAEESPVIHLEDLIQEALKSNPDLKAFHERWQALNQQVVQESSWEDPMLGMEFEGIPKNTLDWGQYGDIEWSISQNIPFPGKLSLKRKMALEEARKAHMEYREKKRQIIADLKTAYADYELIHRTIKILEKNKNLLEQFEEIAKSKYEVGKVSQQDMFKAQVESAKIRNRLLISEQEKEARRAKINMLLARLPDEPLGAPVPVSDKVETLDLDHMIRLAQERRPELKGMEAELRGAQFGLRLARREYWPNFFTKLESRQFQGTGLEEYDVMVGINIPWLWTRGRVAGGVAEARFNVAAVQRSYEAKKWEIFFEIKEALVKVKTSQSLLDLYRTNILPKAEQTVKVSQTGYQTDKIDFLMLLDSQRSLLEFQLENEEAATEYHKNLAELERNVGVALEKSNIKDQKSKLRN